MATGPCSTSSNAVCMTWARQRHRSTSKLARSLGDALPAAPTEPAREPLPRKQLSRGSAAQLVRFAT